MSTARFRTNRQIFYRSAHKLVKLALNENVRSVGNWLANNVDSSVAKSQSNTDDMPGWYASVEPPPPA